MIGDARVATCDYGIGEVGPADGEARSGMAATKRGKPPVMGSPRSVVVDRIGAWPGWVVARDPGMRGVGYSPLAESHAARVWGDALAEVCGRGYALRAAAGGTGGDMRRMQGLVDLEFAGRLGAHVKGCRRCGVVPVGEHDAPVTWLTWAARRKRGVAQVLDPVLMEVGFRRRERTALMGRGRAVRRAG